MCQELEQPHSSHMAHEHGQSCRPRERPPRSPVWFQVAGDHSSVASPNIGGHASCTRGRICSLLLKLHVCAFMYVVVLVERR